MNLEELLARLEALGELSDAELADLRHQLTETYTGLRGGVLSPEIIADLQRVAQGIQTIDGEAVARDEAAAQLEAQAAELDPLVIEADDEPEAEEEPEEVEEPEPGDEPEVPVVEDGAPVETPVVEDGTPVVEDAEPIAAGGTPTPTPLARAAARQPARTRPRPTAPAHARVTAMAGLPDVSAGVEFRSVQSLAESMIQTYEANAGALGAGSKVPVARISGMFDESRRLRSSNSAWQNRALINEYASLEAIVAAGGICAPSTPFYEQTVIGHASRPVRDALPSFPATRGGINWITPPTLTNIGTTGGSPDQAIDQITAAEDAANATKPHQFISCGTPDSATIYATTKILEFGNLMERTFPELVASWISLADTAWSRYAENLLLTTIAAGSTAVTTQQDLGVARDLLNYANLAAVAYRNRHRMPPDSPLRAMFPDWIVGMIQNDMWSALNVGQDAASVTRADIVRWFAFRNVNVTFFEDGVGPGTPAYQIFPAQAAGGLNAWPTVVQWYLFHEGAWIFLDGGTKDFGVVRDSTLNAANKFQMFVETWEEVAHVGLESLRIRSTICANGATAGTIAPDTLCDGGS